MVSDHIAVTPDVAEQYPAPFYEPFTTLSWLAGITSRVRLGTTVLIVPVPASAAGRPDGRQPQPAQRRTAGPGVGVGWARQEFEALGVPFRQRGELTDEYLRGHARGLGGRRRTTARARSRSGSAATATPALRRAVRFGDAWHPLRFTLPWLREALDRLKAIADEQGRPVPALAPRIALRLTDAPVTDPGPARRRGHDRAGPRRPRGAARARRRDRRARPVQRRPGGDPPARRRPGRRSRPWPPHLDATPERSDR